MSCDFRVIKQAAVSTFGSRYIIIYKMAPPNFRMLSWGLVNTGMYIYYNHLWLKFFAVPFLPSLDHLIPSVVQHRSIPLQSVSSCTQQPGVDGPPSIWSPAGWITFTRYQAFNIINFVLSDPGSTFSQPMRGHWGLWRVSRCLRYVACCQLTYSATERKLGRERKREKKRLFVCC